MLGNKNLMRISGLMIFLWMVLVAAATAKEPQKPDVHSPLDKGKEQKISELIGLPLKAAFERLKGIDYVISEELSYKAVYEAFKDRKGEAIALALDSLKFPVVGGVEGKKESRADDFNVARKILEVFPDESVNSVVMLYTGSDAITKGNIVRVLGRMAGGDAVRSLLIEALDDKTPCEEEDPEIAGEPLRICDVAYNQLVLRYKIRNVLRTIGPAYRVEVRDYHIDILKEQLKAGQVQ